MAAGLEVTKALIEYIAIFWKKILTEEKESIEIEFTEQKAGPEMMQMLLTLEY